MSHCRYAPIYCNQVFLGCLAWFIVFSSAFSHAMWSATVVFLVCCAILGAFVSTGIWTAYFRVSIPRLALAYALVSIIWAIFCLTCGLELPSLAFFFGLALTLYLFAFLGGWLSLKLFQQTESETENGIVPRSLEKEANAHEGS